LRSAAAATASYTTASAKDSAARGNAHYGVETGIGGTRPGCARHNIARGAFGLRCRYRPGVDCRARAGHGNRRDERRRCRRPAATDIRLDDWSRLARGADRQTGRIGNPLEHRSKESAPHWWSVLNAHLAL
jgi:hypothetical protein